MNDVRGKRVLVVGLGRSGHAVALCLQRHGAVVTVTDSKPPAAFAPLLPELLAQKIGVQLGSQRAEVFLAHDLVVVSPGVPWDLPQLQATRARGIPVVPEIEVASWYLSDPLWVLPVLTARPPLQLFWAKCSRHPASRLLSAGILVFL